MRRRNEIDFPGFGTHRNRRPRRRRHRQHAVRRLHRKRQTLECATYNKTTAEQLLKDNYQVLLERMGSTYGRNKSQLADITARLKDAQQKWEKLRVTPIARWIPSRR